MSRKSKRHQRRIAEKGHNKRGLGARGAMLGDGWLDDEGFHVVRPVKEPTREALEELTQEYRRHVRNSEIWEYMVKHFGEEKAEEMLKEFRVELR